MRIGIGYDVHRFEENRKLIVGGIEIPYEKGLMGHSDADVLIHSIIDAMLGAAALGDIGMHFPDTDEHFRGVDSKVLLKEVCRLIDAKGYIVVNIDAIIICQEPKMRPFIDKMRSCLAEIICIDMDQINIKATTEEKMGFTGKILGVKAEAVCLLENKI